MLQGVRRVGLRLEAATGDEEKSLPGMIPRAGVLMSLDVATRCPPAGFGARPLDSDLHATAVVERCP